jgi:steroid 5-alpha reductase family enzyme
VARLRRRLPEGFDVYIGLEEAASQLISYESELVPGLLQTEGYARTVIEADNPGVDNEEISRRVHVRMARQSLIWRATSPLGLQVALNEGILRRPVGGPRVMAEQLRSLAGVTELANVSLRVVPLSAGLHAGLMSGPFLILRFPLNGDGKESEPATVYVDGFTGALPRRTRSRTAAGPRRDRAQRGAARCQAASQGLHWCRMVSRAQAGRLAFMSVDVKNLCRVAGASAAVIMARQAATAVVAVRRGRRDYADGVWGPGLAAIALTSAAAGSGDRWRRWTLAAATAVWVARLERQMIGRLRHSEEEDPRYTEFLDGDSTAAVVAKVFVPQGLSQLLVSASVQLAAASTLPRTARRWLFPAGIAVMLTGAVIEALADHQKTQFQQRGDDKPDLLDTGLWGWSRHPNYFGDSVVWDGAWLAAAASSPGAWTVPAPVAMSYLLIFATGAKRTEARMQKRPGYRDYQQRVPIFFPRPPKTTVPAA